MMRKCCLGLLAGLLLGLFGVGPVHAQSLDASTAESYCEAVKDASVRAIQDHIIRHTPEKDPLDVFDNAVQSCLANIANFQIPTISPWGEVLRKLLKKMQDELINKVCQAARSEIDGIVSDAQRTVDDATKGIYDIGIEDGLGGTIHSGDLGVGRTNVPIPVPGTGSGSGRFFNNPPPKQ